MSDQLSEEKVIQDILFILDESGSMSSMGIEPVQAVNKFINDQKVAMGDDGATFSLWKFNSTVVKVIDDVPLKDVGEFSDFQPKDMTSLYDAIGHAINTKKKKNSFDNVVCIILTDGLENSSTEYSASNIRSMIKDMEDNHNWKFVYLGANQDAFAVGGSMGVGRCAQYTCAPGEMIGVTREVSEAVTSYRAHSSNVGRKAALTLPERPTQTHNEFSSRRQMTSP
jgi:hypothetical protein